MPTELFLKVAVDAPLLHSLTYKTTQNLPSGTSVIVPLGKRKANAVIIGEGAPDGAYTVKDIESMDDTRPLIAAPYMQWLEWLSDYYVYPIGQVMALPFPPLAKKNSNRLSQKAPVVPNTAFTKPPSLTAEQTICVQKISTVANYQTHLLHGVTGSGKTEVYLQLLENTLKNKKRGLVLVPEISLTPQLIQRFSSRFGDKIAVLHSHLTDRERTNQWWSIVDRKKEILIGARSALFCPIDDLGIIIVDEEHEPSYKQDEKLRYNARDAAIVLAKTLDISIVLGSATPSLESWHNAQTGKYQLHTMSKRVADRALPQTAIVDLRQEKIAKKEDTKSQELPFWLSRVLYNELVSTLQKREQAALFLNRRGMSTTVLCEGCGFVHKCPNCEISLTLHGAYDLVCHYCDYAIRFSDSCPSCKVGEMKGFGLGTEQLEENIRQLFPDARVARADRDEINSRETLEHLIEQMENHEIDILIGTQMIAKGLDFTKLTLVGLVLADIGFNMPDFRSTERSFQLLTQVSGRAGRHIESGGQVFIQTYNPEHASLEFCKKADYLSFANFELKEREELGYPPFGRLAVLRVIATDTKKGAGTIEMLAQRARTLSKKFSKYKNIKILGPTEAPLAKLRGKYRYHILLKSPGPNILSEFTRRLIGGEPWIPAGTKVQVDIDPLNLL